MKKNGISMIILAITIIIMLIIAGTVIITLTDTNIIDKANDASNKTNLSTERETLVVAYSNMQGKINTADYEKNLKDMVGKENVEVIDYKDAVKVTYKQSNNSYWIMKENKQIAEAYVKKTDTIKSNTEEYGTIQNPYVIETIDDLIKISIMSNITNDTNGKNVGLGLSSTNFSGKYVVLSRDLDFADINSYENPYSTEYNAFFELYEKVTLGDATLFEILTDKKINGNYYPISNYLKNTFEGNFNGNGHIIKNCIKIGYSNGRGIFGKNSGIISNFNIDVSLEWENHYVQSGMICYTNTGTIQDCRVYGKILCTCSGAIVQTNKGTVKRCINYAIMPNSEGWNNGGIASVNDGLVEQCINYANINNSTNIGGIVGINNASGIIKDCYNVGNIGVNWNRCSGICGANTGTIQNCYNKGKVSSNWNKFGIAENSGDTATIANSYSKEKAVMRFSFDSTNIQSFDYDRTEEVFRSQEMVNLLNAERENNVWKKDTNNINEGYPILNWQ